MPIPKPISAALASQAPGHSRECWREVPRRTAGLHSSGRGGRLLANKWRSVRWSFVILKTLLWKWSHLILQQFYGNMFVSSHYFHFQMRTWELKSHNWFKFTLFVTVSMLTRWCDVRLLYGQTLSTLILDWMSVGWISTLDGRVMLVCTQREPHWVVARLLVKRSAPKRAFWTSVQGRVLSFCICSSLAKTLGSCRIQNMNCLSQLYAIFKFKRSSLYFIF